jgi:hypothetical protein
LSLEFEILASSSSLNLSLFSSSGAMLSPTVMKLLDLTTFYPLFIDLALLKSWNELLMWLLIFLNELFLDAVYMFSFVSVAVWLKVDPLLFEDDDFSISIV